MGARDRTVVRVVVFVLFGGSDGAGRLERGKTHWARPLAMLLRAALAVSRGRRSDAVALLASAATALHTSNMDLFAATARRRQGELLGGQEGSLLLAEADAWMMN